MRDVQGISLIATNPTSHWPLSLLLILAILTLFWPALIHPYHILHSTIVPFSDLMVIHWPKAHLMIQSWQAGQGLPHWTPLILSGMPLAANQLAMLFYPLAWLFLILPLEPTFNLLFIFHLWLGGFGIYSLLREGYRLSPSTALLGGLTFALNGKWLAHAAGGHVSMVGAIGWMPWTLFGMQMLLQNGGREVEEQRSRWVERRWSSLPRTLVSLLPDIKWVMLVAVALTMQIFTHTLLLIYTVYILAAMVIWHIVFISGVNRNKNKVQRTDENGGKTVRRLVQLCCLPMGLAENSEPNPPKDSSPVRFTEIKRLLLPLLLIPILAGLLGAVQLIPLVELAQFSNRTLSLSQAAEFAFSPAQLLIGLILPNTQGGHEFVIYLGLVPLLLAPFGLTRKNRWTWFYGILFVFTILFALGPTTPLHGLFYYLAPGFRWVRTPARMFFVGAMAIAVLVGFGVDHLAQHRWSPLAKRWLTRIAFAMGSLALLTGLGLIIGFDQVNQATIAFTILIPIGLSLILLRGHRIISAPLATTLLGVILFLDLASFDTSMMRFIPLEEALAPGRAAAEYLAQKPGHFRVYSPSYSLPVQTAAATGLYLADGVEPVHLAVYDQYMARAGGYGDPGFTVTIPNFGGGELESALREAEPNLRLLGLLNVRYLASAFPMDWPGLNLETEIEGTFIYRNEQALPRAWVAHQAVAMEMDWLAQLESLPNLANVVILEKDSSGRAKTGLSGEKAASGVNIRHYSANLVELETKIAEPGWLVLSEIWYPGWQATVNGSPEPVERVNGLLRSLYLSQPGSYEIRLEYRPRYAVWGPWITRLTGR